MNNFINLLLSGSTLLLGFLIYLNPNKVNIKANRWLSLFMCCFFLLTIEETLAIAGIKLTLPFVTEIIGFQGFIIAPVFYISILYFINPVKKWQRKDYFHFTFGALYILFSAYIFLFFRNDSEVVIDKNSLFSTILTFIFVILFGLQFIIYCVLSYLRLLRHQKNILSFRSTIEDVDLKWLEYIVIGVVVMGSLFSLDLLFELHASDFVVVNLIYLIGVFIIAYHAMQQQEIYPFTIAQKAEIMDIVNKSEFSNDDKKKLVSDEKLEDLKSALIQLMESKKPYLDCEISLVKLADQMDTSTHLLSYTINKGFNENFYQFVNGYRIEAAKKLLKDERMNHLSLVGIAFEVGFNSKTVFNTTFKKITNFTPSAYKNNSND